MSCAASSASTSLRLLHGEFGQRAATDQRVAMLNLFDDGCGSGPAADHVAQVLGNLLGGFGSAVGEEKYSLLRHSRASSRRNSRTMLHDCLHIFDRRAGNNAVAEVEDVAGTAGGGAQNLFDALLQ